MFKPTGLVLLVLFFATLIMLSACGGGSGGGSAVVISTVPTVYNSVGATVSGLAGTGLVLELNGQYDLPVGADGSFAFSNTLASGSAYEVSVKAYPAGLNQNCTVDTGSGIMDGQDITDVSVQCETLTYKLNVSVSGMYGTGFELLDSHTSQTIPVTRNASPVFTLVQNDGTAYGITVKTQPSTPGQTCTVTGGTGTISGSDVNISIACVSSQYTVGGTFSGAGAGFTLGYSYKTPGSDLGVTQSVRFLSGAGYTSTWATFPDGTKYGFSITAQPTGEVCTVANPSGTVNGSNITGVDIICTVIQRSIGGSVSGLNASGLVLNNNVQEDLPVSSGATTFTFTTAAADNGPYNVTVKTHPASLKCTVSSGSGTASADVTGVSVSCAANATPVPEAGTYGVLYFIANSGTLDASSSTGIDAGDTHVYTWSETSANGITFGNNDSANDNDTTMHYDFDSSEAVVYVEYDLTVSDGLHDAVTGSSPASLYLYNNDYAYVTIAGGGDGSAPDNALGNIASAIDYAVANGKKGVAVAEGVYDVSFEDGSHIVMQDGVSLYGGYDETTWQRDPDTNITQIRDYTSRPGGHGWGDPIRVVEAGPALTRATEISGFKISGPAFFYSAAIFINGGSPTVDNNYIYAPGGRRAFGIYMQAGASPLITNNRVHGGGTYTQTDSTAHGVFIDQSSPMLSGNEIMGGLAEWNYGVYAKHSTVHLYNNYIQGGWDAVGYETADHTVTYGIYIFNTVGKVYNNTINGGAGPSATGIYLGGVTPAFRNNLIFTESTGTSDTWLFGKCVTEGYYRHGDPDSDPVAFQNNAMYCGQALYLDGDKACTGNADGDDNSATCTVAELNALTDITTGGNIGGKDYAYFNFTDSDGISDDMDDLFDNDWTLSGSASSALTDGGLCLWPYISTDKDGVTRTPAAGFPSGCASPTGWSIGAHEKN